MSELMDAIQQRHQENLEQLQRGEVDDAFLDGVRALIADLRQAGALVADPDERGQLRALMRFWGNVLYDHTGVYPDTTLQPLDPERARPPEEQKRRRVLGPLAREGVPPIVWGLVGGALLILAMILSWTLLEGTEMATPTVEPTLDEVATRQAESMQMLRSTSTAQALEAGNLATAAAKTEATAAFYATAAVRAEATAAFQATRAAEQEQVSPAFSDITVALGVQPDGTPILAPPENRFDWNTKVVYAVFDYAGMRDGVKWSAVWTRGGEEVARQEDLWDVDAFGKKGTHWVAYSAEQGQTLRGGDYGVTLSIEGVVQETTEFNVLYYTPSD